MIGIDTNVLVRFITEDNRQQWALAVDLLNQLSPKNPGWVSLVTAVELEWVLSRSYRMKRADVVICYQMLLQVEDLRFEYREFLERALESYERSSAGLGDHVIAMGGRESGCSATFTFDKDAARAAGMTLLG